MISDPLGERCDEVGFRLAAARLWLLAELELAERLFELVAHAVERRVGVRRDHRADEFECQADRPRLEWCQARRVSERVTVELLVNVDLVSLERRVDRVTTTAEVDEVQQLQVLFELILRNVEALDDLMRRNDGVDLLAARGEEVREQRLEDGEPLRHDRPGWALAQAVLAWRRSGRC